MEKFKFKDLMDALNMRMYNVDKYDIIECYSATRFTVGQIRLLLSSLSTKDFRYRALLVLIEYLPNLDEQDAIHVINSVSECESQYEMRIKVLKLLIEHEKLSNKETRENLCRIITGRSLTLGNDVFTELAIPKIITKVQNNSDNLVTTNGKTESLSSTEHSLISAKENRLQKLEAQRKYMMNNRIYPLKIPTFEIDENTSSDSLKPSTFANCCIL